MNTVIIPTEYADVLHRLNTVFLAKNSQINLSALRTEDACFTGNILDSLSAHSFITSIGTTGSLLDVGTGGGFPLLPLAITLPNWQCTGLDSVQKKIDAIKQIALECNIKNVQFICSRTEVAGQNTQYRERYDIVTSRALAPLPILLEYMAPFVKPGGKLLCYKSMHIAEELVAAETAIKLLQLELSDTLQYELPGDFGVRQLLVYTKKSSLPKMYPREVGIPKKTPL